MIEIAQVAVARDLTPFFDCPQELEWATLNGRRRCGPLEGLLVSVAGTQAVAHDRSQIGEHGLGGEARR